MRFVKSAIRNLQVLDFTGLSCYISFNQQHFKFILVMNCSHYKPLIEQYSAAKSSKLKMHKSSSLELSNKHFIRLIG